MERKSGQDLIQVIIENKGKVIGGLIGLVTAILFLKIGILRTFLLLIFTMFGLIIGANWDQGGKLKEILNNVLSKFLPSWFR